ncbi:MAG: carboxypeptidase-like regulatory domain-containing protein [Prevotellaceae bacterium]|nr:carboxypeptidase-like regulatory domain-containing protein [Prevotellaceae bacterium]
MKKIIWAASAGLILTTILLFTCSRSEVDMFGNINGIVTDFKSGEPVWAAGVTLNPGGVKTTTGNDGRYEYHEIDPGQYTVQVMKDGYQTASLSVTMQAGVAKTVDVQLNVGTGILTVDRLKRLSGLIMHLRTLDRREYNSDVME